MSATTASPSILLVDDDPINRRVMASVIEGIGETTFATSGAEALALARALRQPDLIILDIMMPDLDGFAVCEELKSDPAMQDIPIIFVTALNDAVSEERGLKAGAVDYIHKPISRAIVRARVETHLELRAHRAFAPGFSGKRHRTSRR